MEAAREGHEEMVALLLSQGADINAQTEETQETALTLACCGGFLEVTDFLIKAGADLELGASTPLMEAAQEGHVDLVRYLIGAGASVNACTATGDTALTYACENGHTDVADLLLQAGAAMEHESEGGRTPLMKAARAGNVCTVKFLLAKGAEPNKRTTSNDHTPLSLACAGGHLQVARMLLDAGANPAHRLKDNSSMLIEAAKGGHLDTVRLLLDYRKDCPLGLGSTTPTGTATTPPTTTTIAGTVSGVPAIAPAVPATCPAAAAIAAAAAAATVPVVPSGASAKTCIHKMQDMKDATAVPAPLPPNARIPPPSDNSSTAAVAAAPAAVASISATPAVALASALSGGAQGKDAAELRADFEQCLSSIMKGGPMLPLAAAATVAAQGGVSTNEEKLRNKQQILEELQKVERELQEKVPKSCKTDARGFLTSLVNNAVNETAHFVAQQQPDATSAIAAVATVTAATPTGASSTPTVPSPAVSAVIPSVDGSAQVAVTQANGGLMVAAPPRTLQQEQQQEQHVEQEQDATAICTGVTGTAGQIIPVSPATPPVAGTVPPPNVIAGTGDVLAPGSLLLDVEWQTDSNHDTALTLACSGGHKELVGLLIAKGANIEHRDKKGFTPLMLAATAGHAGRF